MASTTKATTKWGSFFEKAVAGVESRLDTILGEEDGSSNAAKPVIATKPQQEKSGSSLNTESVKQPDIIQVPPNKRPERLQERLAKAIGGRGSPAPGSSTTSIASTSPRASLDKENTRASSFIIDDDGTNNSSDVDIPPTQLKTVDTSLSTAEPKTIVSEPDFEGSDDAHEEAEISTPNTFSGVRTEEAGSSEDRNDQEIHAYLEQIESLRAKLQFLTQQAASEARERASNADSGSLSRQLAEKDEKIALLLDEGSKLSHNEMKLMTTIKSLRSKASEDQKQIVKAKQNEEQADKSIKTLQERLRTAEAYGKDESKQKTALENIKRDLDQARNDAQAKSKEISELQGQLMQNALEGQKAEKVRAELEVVKRVNHSLQEEVSDAKLERTLLEDRHKVQTKALESKSDREAQNFKSTELDLRRELQVLEGRLETYRIKTEEISTDAKADVQAKLVRQIETLQSSYSVASENWKGIESALMARIAILEKDQAEAQKKETELRRKLREAASKRKEAETALETYISQAQDLEEKLGRETENHKQTTSALNKSQTDLKAAHEDFKMTKESMESRLERLETEKRNAVQENLLLRSRAQSPQVKGHFEPSISSSRRYPQSLGLSIPNGLGLSERPQSRRSSAQPSPAFTRQDSVTSLPSSSKNSIPPTPVINEIEYDDDDDFFAATPATPPDRAIHDMVSTSTAAAGPSVQLVERMSAAVRRLESEKQASKDELERLSVQRDEARNQVVGLMQELEVKKQVEARTTNLEREVDELTTKLQTTLEMLGEKSELVEELRADIADMKDIYKATLESTVK